jgi:hypothetical protein
LYDQGTFALLKPGEAQALLSCGSEHIARYACIVLAQAPSDLHLVFLDVSAVAASPVNSSRDQNTSSWVSVINDSAQCWPKSLLPSLFPGESISILPCQLPLAELRSSKQRGRAVAASILQAAALQEDCQQQLVLVGHGFGGHLLKVRADQTLGRDVTSLYHEADASTLPSLSSVCCRGTLQNLQ